MCLRIYTILTIGMSVYFFKLIITLQFVAVLMNLATLRLNFVVSHIPYVDGEITGPWFEMALEPK